jgi:hypothetical protein
MAQVLQTNCDYKIKTQTDGRITLDTSEVLVTGNLRVEGDYVVVNVANLDIEDNIVTLNNGETGDGVTEGYSGIRVDRGFGVDSSRNSYPTFWYDELAGTWEIVNAAGSNVLYADSNLKVRRILTSSFTDNGNLILIGAGEGVVTVEGTTNYELQVTQDDHIPNKKYVDVAIVNRPPDNEIKRDDTYVIVQDIDGGASANAIMSIQYIQFPNPGANYSVGDILVLVGGLTRRNARIRVDTVDNSGGILTYTLIDSGLFFSIPPSINNIATTTNGFGFNATVNVIWGVQEVEIVNAGNDYESVTVSFQPGTDLGAGIITATADAVVDLDVFSTAYQTITSITVTAFGEYDYVPAVTFSSGTNLSLTESQVRIVVDDVLSATFYEDRFRAQDFEFADNEILNVVTDTNLKLTTLGTGNVEINRALQFEAQATSTIALNYVAGSTVLYGNPNDSSIVRPTPGGTGLYFNNLKQSLSWSQWVINNPATQNNPSNLVAYPVKNELISKQKALVMSMLF